MPSSIVKQRIEEWQLCGPTMGAKGFQAWIFCSGMQFNAPNKWWGDLGKRDFSHEGLDFCLYIDANGDLHKVDPSIQIPAILDGRIRAVFNDFLGKAIIIEHNVTHEGSTGFLSIYAHTVPRTDLSVGVMVKKGDIIATIAGVKKTRTNILPHLHLSFGWPTPLMGYDHFQWPRLRNPDLIQLIDPLDLLACPYEMVGRDDAICGQSGLTIR